ncbi:MAG TPA: magnesium transporter [Anaerolineae bacterium]|nr:magnesium transporter [Anaerolineae bacterium]
MRELANTKPLEVLLDLIKAQKYPEAIKRFVNLRPADQAEIFNSLDDEERTKIIEHLDISATADLFDELEDDETLDVAESLPTEKLADILDEMDPDEAADLLGDLSPGQAKAALAHMEEPEEVIPLLAYPDETAGGRMTTAYVTLQRRTTVAQAIHFLQEVSPDSDVPYYLFVVDKDKKLIGVVGLRALVIAKPSEYIENIMDPHVVYVNAQTDQEEAARIMTRYDLSALPVVDEQRRLIGVITHDDILDVLEDEATEDIYRLASVSDTDLKPDSPITEQLRGRLPWLLLNTCTAMFAAWIISNFKDLFVQVAVLAFFQSVVAGQGGNAASQNVAMFVRAIALKKIEVKNIWWILIKQLIVGLLQGIVIGLIVGLGVSFWQHNPFLGLVIGLALICNSLVAVTVGTLIPLFLKSVGQDPALASSVLVTAATDSFGFLIFLSLAKVFLPYIQHYL